MLISLFSFINGNENKLLFYFLKYYIELGIDPKNMFIIIHIASENNETNESIKLLNSYNIKYEVSKVYTSNIKTSFVNNYIKTLPITSYLIYPDLDEFFYYNGMKINDFICGMEKNNIRIVQAEFCNRICNIDTSHKTLFEQFPICFYDPENKITKGTRYSKYKIIVLKLKENDKYINSHEINQMKGVYFTPLNITFIIQTPT